MKNVFFALAFMLMGTFAFANDYKTSKTEEIKAEQSINNMVFIDSISIDDDICTVTSTVTVNGTSYSATATSHTGDCTAARNAARSRARLLASVFAAD